MNAELSLGIRGRGIDVERLAILACLPVEMGRTTLAEYRKSTWEEAVFGVSESNLVSNPPHIRFMMAILRAHQEHVARTIYPAVIKGERLPTFSMEIQGQGLEAQSKRLGAFLLKAAEGKLYATEVIQLGNLLVRLSGSSPAEVTKTTLQLCYQTYFNNNVRFREEEVVQLKKVLLGLIHTFDVVGRATLYFLTGQTAATEMIAWEYYP